MLKVFLSTHGAMSSGIKNSLEILMGDMSRLTVFDAYIDERSVQTQLDLFYETVTKEDSVLLLSDLLGGSVNQVMCRYLDRPNTRLITGVNLPFMLLLMSEDEVSESQLDEMITESRTLLKRIDLNQLESNSQADEDAFF